MKSVFSLLLFISFEAFSYEAISICHALEGAKTAQKIHRILIKRFSLPANLIGLTGNKCTQKKMSILQIRAVQNDFEILYYDHQSFRSLFDVFLEESKEFKNAKEL